MTNEKQKIGIVTYKKMYGVVKEGEDIDGEAHLVGQDAEYFVTTHYHPQWTVGDRTVGLKDLDQVFVYVGMSAALPDSLERNYPKALNIMRNADPKKTTYITCGCSTVLENVLQMLVATGEGQRAKGFIESKQCHGEDGLYKVILNEVLEKLPN